MSVFSPDYRTARIRFLAACAGHGLMVESCLHPLHGPAGEALAIDVARRGPPDAAQWLVLFSATHGTEGAFGSAAQLALVERAPALPAGVALLLVHGLNPWGFAWGRRTTEDNVDLNRNWIDFARPRPANADYGRLAAALEPSALDPETLSRGDRALAAFRAVAGEAALQAALSGGQYDHPEGLFFGGFGPTWSRRRLAEILRRHLAPARTVAAIDCHTGLGPYGSAEIITLAAAGSTAYRRARAWWGAQLASTADGDSVSSALTGTLDEGVAALLGDAALVFVALEVGTYDLATTLAVLRDDGWLHRHGALDDDRGRALKARIRDHFAPADPAWQRAVLGHAAGAIDAALSGLARGA